MPGQFLMNGTIMRRRFPTDNNPRLINSFYTEDVLKVAPGLLGKYLSVRQNDGTVLRYMITETEAYRGSDDKACHASKGETARNRVMFGRGGLVYVYFIYGMYWMLNVVTGKEQDPQAVLIRGVEGFAGPGKLTRALRIDGSFYGEDLVSSDRIWIEEGLKNFRFRSLPRVGIDYAGEPWISMPWRFVIDRKD